MLFANECAARDESSAANTSEEVIELANLVKEFECRGALTGDDVFIVEWRNVCHFTLIFLLRDHLVQIIFEAIEEHDFGTVASYGCLFNFWSIRRQYDASLYAKKLSGKGNSLTMVAS